MKRIITIISAATTVLAFYNEARRAGLIEPIDFKPIRLLGNGKKQYNNAQKE